MEMSKLINTLLSSTYFYIGAGALLALIIFSICRKSYISKLNNQLKELTKDFTSNSTVPLAYMMNKASALARTNQQAKEVVDSIGSKYQEAISELGEINELIENSEDYLATKKYRDAKNNNKEIRTKIDDVEGKVIDVKLVLESVIKQEQKQRDEINIIKDKFHDIKISFAENSQNYVYSYDALQTKIVGIENEFSKFEEFMYNSNFVKANELNEKIKVDISDLEGLLDVLPNLLVLARNTLPKQMEEVNGNYVQTKNKGAYLEHLDIERNIETVNTVLRLELSHLKEAVIDDCLNNLSDCVVRLNQLNEAIAKESKAFDSIDDLKTKTYSQVDMVKSVLDGVKKTYEKASERFGLDSLGIKIDSYEGLIKGFEDQKTDIERKITNKQSPASEIYLLLQQLDQNVQIGKEDLLETKKMLDDACMDEQDAKDTLAKLYLIINEIQSCVRKQRLVSISSSYHDDLLTAKSYISKIEELLKENPLNIPTLNAYIKEGRDYIYTLFNDVNKILGSARLVEDAIVVGNKSRSSYPDINADLTSSEIAYENGEYTNALKIVFGALDKIYPNQATQMLKERKN